MSNKNWLCRLYPHEHTYTGNIFSKNKNKNFIHMGDWAKNKKIINKKSDKDEDVLWRW